MSVQKLKKSEFTKKVISKSSIFKFAHQFAKLQKEAVGDYRISFALALQSIYDAIATVYSEYLELSKFTAPKKSDQNRLKCLFIGIRDSILAAVKKIEDSKDKIIEKLLSRGLKIWEKEGKRRIYINSYDEHVNLSSIRKDIFGAHWYINNKSKAAVNSAYYDCVTKSWDGYGIGRLDINPEYVNG